MILTLAIISTLEPEVTTGPQHFNVQYGTLLGGTREHAAGGQRGANCWGDLETRSMRAESQGRYLPASSATTPPYARRMLATSLLCAFHRPSISMSVVESGWLVRTAFEKLVTTFLGSYAMELPGMPSFRSQIEDRRYNDGPVHFPLHTAYVELYGGTTIENPLGKVHGEGPGQSM
ncbi:hypothetical protein HPB51_008432 [Rhipicephalus microplus]|uniref:Uncharacterized protein n=1 Tax=Rhipicephalus microplus TaxID=6941 RepID=A0A9J6EFV1_RHIMP|nr:hypothetical protein HPB51_008432 [Rhipicephalus microplus]